MVQSLVPARIRLRHLQPLCLALLARQPGSGYDVVSALSALSLFATARPDAPGVYRTLQAFEKRGLLRGRRQLSNKGPSRRMYTLTPDGEACLAQWQKVLLSARGEIDAVMALVQQGRKIAKPNAAKARTRAPSGTRASKL
ncbi:MAG: PadR family transcriptional regulator [Kiritimatiellia bacterium]